MVEPSRRTNSELQTVATERPHADSISSPAATFAIVVMASPCSYCRTPLAVVCVSVPVGGRVVPHERVPLGVGPRRVERGGHRPLVPVHHVSDPGEQHAGVEHDVRLLPQMDLPV